MWYVYLVPPLNVVGVVLLRLQCVLRSLGGALCVGVFGCLGIE